MALGTKGLQAGGIAGLGNSHAVGHRHQAASMAVALAVRDRPAQPDRVDACDQVGQPRREPSSAPAPSGHIKVDLPGGRIVPPQRVPALALG